jgi:hypothetical protein
LPTLRGARSLEIRKVDFTLVHVDRFHADFHAVAQTIGLAAGFANQTLPDLVETVVVVIQEETCTRPSINSSSRRTKKPKPVTLAITP